MPVNGKSGSSTVTSLRDRIGKAPQVVKKLVTFPEWDNVTLELRGITLGARSRIQREAQTTGSAEPNYEVFYPLVLTEGCFDPETGEPVFPDTPEGRAFINSLNPNITDRAAKDIMAMSGLTKAAETELGNGSGESLGSTAPSPSLSS